MDFRQLRALLAVADTGSVKRAAQLLNIVQPAVTRQVQMLEQDVGVELFVRGRHGMALTEAGAVLVERARRALGDLDRARDEIRPAAMTGTVTLGLLPSTAPLLSAALFRAVAAAWPGVMLRLITGYSGNLQGWLEQGEIDAALLYGGRTYPTLTIAPLLQEKLMLVGHPDRPRPCSGPCGLHDLTGLPMVLPNPPHGIRMTVAERCAANQVTMNIVAETNSLEIQQQLVRDDIGLTILPAIALIDPSGGTAAASLWSMPFAEPEMARSIVLAMPANRRVAPVARRVADLVTVHLHTRVRSGDWPTAVWLGK